ncbi:putative transcription factor B3-Domain family [Lupinus albus]|uniref:Putative transcription factor B3-Domain family n=1 Tax=Lupinus albus TaxID=3870 RepID=A0A6A4NCC9_LUPAL|nr:putative transcription factor B3-Domain family [Lupinus albus]
MDEQSCEKCISWADDIYWSHFQVLHFAHFLCTDFDQHLALPKTFSDNLKKKLPEKAGLRGPGGVVWKIGLTTRDDTLYFTHGWQEFVKDNSLKENDFLVFKYNGGQSLFDVLIFDGESFCEKAASYFVRKCVHTEHVDGCSSKRKDTDNYVEQGNTPSDAGVECAAHEKSVHDNAVGVPAALPSGTPVSERTLNAGVESASPEQFMHANGDTVAKVVPLKTAEKGTGEVVSAVKNASSKRRGRPPRVSRPSQEVVDWVSDSEAVAQGAENIESYTSNRRPVTEHEINSALLLAQAASTNNSLLIVMRPTHVYKRFYLPIPNNWIMQHLSLRSQDLIFRIGTTEWRVKYCFHRNRYIGGLTVGWRNLTLDNNLEEFDVCVFEPASKVNDTMIIDMKIFRVVDDIAPLTIVKSPGKKGRKRAINEIQT